MSWPWEAREKIGETLSGLPSFHDYRLGTLKREASLLASSPAAAEYQPSAG